VTTGGDDDDKDDDDSFCFAIAVVAGFFWQLSALSSVLWGRHNPPLHCC